MDVFFRPAIGPPDRLATRWFPTHFITLWMVDLPSRHGGRLGDLGWALTWTVGALAVAWAVVTATNWVTHRSHQWVTAGSDLDQFLSGLRMGLRDYRRNSVL